MGLTEQMNETKEKVGMGEERGRAVYTWRDGPTFAQR